MLIEEGGVKHYCLVKDRKALSRLLSSQISNHNGELYFCLNCLNPFQFEKSLNEHREYCYNYEAVTIEMPKKRTMLRSLKTITEGKGFLLSFTLTLSVILNRYNRVTRMIKKVIPSNTKNTNHLAFAIISCASMIRYINRE